MIMTEPISESEYVPEDIDQLRERLIKWRDEEPNVPRVHKEMLTEMIAILDRFKQQETDLEAWAGPPDPDLAQYKKDHEAARGPGYGYPDRPVAPWETQ